MKQHTIELLCFLRLFGDRPRLIFDDVLIDPRNELPHVFETPREIVVIEIVSITLDDPPRQFADLGVTFRFSRRRNVACAILGNHRCCAAEKISQVIGEIAVETLNDRLDGEVAVLAEDHFPQQVIAQKLRSKNFVEDEWVHHIPA